MNNRRPLLGLLKYAFYSARGDLAFALLFGLAVGILSLIADNYLISQTLFPLLMSGGPAYVVIMKSEGTPLWDQFQVAMPIKRKEVATAPYLGVLLASLLGIPIFVVISGIRFILHEGSIGSMLSTGISYHATVLGTILIMSALLYPLAYTKLGQRSLQGLFVMCTCVAAAINSAILIGGNNLGLPEMVITSLNITISGIAFFVSLFIARQIYAKIDF